MSAGPSSASGVGPWTLQYGARPLRDGSTHFRVWAPKASRLAVQIIDEPVRFVPMQSDGEGNFACTAPNVREGAEYFYVIDDTRQRPDPVSRSQPHGVHGPSRVVDPHAFRWSDGSWNGLALEEMVFYEIHTGTFTPEGTFEAIAGRLPYLRELGVTAVELMPVASFPGGRNWGYDGVHLYAPQCTYGGGPGLKHLVDACHRHGMALVLDVVYNHLGPEGNYLPEFAPFQTGKYRTPWGEAINFDGAECDGVRRHMIDNALYWLTEFHVDALRIDAIHGIFDLGARHILDEMRESFHAQAAALGKRAWLIAESDLNDVRVIRTPEQGGLGMDAQWSDDFHHAVHALLTGSAQGYFRDFGDLEHLQKAIVEGFVLDGRRSIHRRRRHGSPSSSEPGHRFVAYCQNHDQIANASLGERLSTLVSLEQQKLAACVLLCAPNLPLLFMGQEWGEVAPFHYFISHGDPELVDAVREGRRAEFAPFEHFRDFPDPQDRHTFENSKLGWNRLTQSPHRHLLALHKDLLRLRRVHPALANLRKDLCEARIDPPARSLVVHRRDPASPCIVAAFNFSSEPKRVELPSAEVASNLLLWSAAPQYGGSVDAIAPPQRIDAGSASIDLAACSAAMFLAER